MATNWITKLPFPIWKSRAKKHLQDFASLAATEGVNFFKSNFARQGFLDDHQDFWPERKNKKDPGRLILVGKGSGRLKRSIRKEVNGLDIKWVSDTPYSAIHNEGGTIAVTQTVKAHVRKIESGTRQTIKYVDPKKNKGQRIKVTKTAQGIAMVKAHTRKLNTKMPKRQFIGYSQTLIRNIGGIYQDQMKKLFS